MRGAAAASHFPSKEGRNQGLPQIKDTDYLSVSARIHAMENRLLTRERLARMVEAKEHEEALKVLSECGYEELSTLTYAGLDELLSRAREELYRDLTSAVPDKRMVTVFQMKYDYHNAKALLKAQAVGAEADRLLMSGGRWTPQAVKDAFLRDELGDFTEPFRLAVEAAKEALNAGGDPQLADFILDAAYFEEMRAAAQAVGSPFLAGYVTVLTDITNLRSAVRAARLGKGGDFLAQVLLPGGSVSERALTLTKGPDLETPFRSGALAEAAALGATLAAPGAGELTTFERLCDNALMNYLSGAKRVPFGPETVVAYLYARESELTAVRIVLSGRLAGLDADIIRERLRDAYV